MNTLTSDEIQDGIESALVQIFFFFSWGFLFRVPKFWWEQAWGKVCRMPRWPTTHFSLLCFTGVPTGAAVAWVQTKEVNPLGGSAEERRETVHTLIN